MNGLGKISKRNGSYSKGGRSVSIFEAIRQARMLNGNKSNSSQSTILHKDWDRKK